MDTSVVSGGVSGDLLSSLARASAQPLWDRYQRITRRQPSARAQALHWAWAVMDGLIARAVDEVSLADAERRVLLMTDPQLPAAATTANLLAGLQTLLPGETAQPHRHALSALRMVMTGEGATTTVNDEQCPMAPGDLILTPSWTWHRHHHAGSERMVWFDGLDLPLCAHLDTMFFEHAASGATPPVAPAPTRAAPAHPLAAALPPDAAAPGGGSRFRYGAARAQAALATAPAAEDGSRWLRYVDGITGGPVLPSIDCYRLGLAAGRPTARRRSTAAQVALVLDGRGRSQVGERTVEWSRHDVFTLPAWQWVRHEAQGEAVLFLMSDRELLASLSYLREETAA